MKTSYFYFVILIIFIILFIGGCEEDNIEVSNETVTDIDGNVYKTIAIGNQVWMAENLRTRHFADGTEITLVENKT